MSHIRPFDMPTLEEFFGGKKRVYDPLVRAGITTLTPLFLTPEGLLQRTVKGLGPQRDAEVTSVLRTNSIRRHKSHEDIETCIDRTFGDIKDAPVGVLHVRIDRKQSENRPMYVPLELIKLLEEHEPHMTITDLAELTRRELMYIGSGVNNQSLSVDNIREEVQHVVSRLAYFDISLAVPAPIAIRKFG